MWADAFSSSVVAFLDLENESYTIALLIRPKATSPLLWQPGHVVIFLLFDNLQLRFHLMDITETYKP